MQHLRKVLCSRYRVAYTLGLAGGVVVLFLVSANGMSSLATTTAPGTTLGAVPASVISMINRGGGPSFTATSSTPVVPATAALTTALAKSPWQGKATGISLFRVSNVTGVSGPGLVWVVSIKPTSPVYQAGAVAPTPGESVTPPKRVAANYVLDIIDATTGQWVTTTYGYAPSLAP